MSVRKQALKYTAAAVAVAALIIVASTLYLSPSLGNSGQRSGVTAKLVIQLTDPPIVPQGTSSLNLTYSSIGLLVGEPASNGLQTTKTVGATPSGGSATLDLLELQNISQTIALASLPNGSTIYSFSLTVTGISIDVNGTKSPVTLASGGTTLTVTLAKPSTLQGVDVALLQLNPVVVSTPNGYQIIPSAVGIIRTENSGNQNEQQVGYQQQLSSEDENQLESAQGNVTATLSALSVSGNTTTITVQVKNTGNATVVLNAISVLGNFTAVRQVCSTNGGETETQSQTQTTESEGQVSTNTTVTATTAQQSQNHTTDNESQDSTTTTSMTANTSTNTTTGAECEMEHADEVVFVPVNSTVSGTSCVSLGMRLVSSDLGENSSNGLVLSKGQCVDLTFSGTMSFGEGGLVLVPSTAPGQVYGLHIIASEGANLELSCTIPATPTGCSVIHQEGDS